MEIKKITKTDGKRLFVEIGKTLKSGEGHLPDLKKGDEVGVLTFRKINSEELEKLLGKYVKFLELDEKEGFVMWFEGIIKENKKEFWDDDHELKGRYALISYEFTDKPEGEATEEFNELEVFDFKVLPDKIKSIEKTQCTNQKCKKYSLAEYKFCPNCGKKKKKWQE
jgi:hypothetical protein